MDGLVESFRAWGPLRFRVQGVGRRNLEFEFGLWGEGSFRLRVQGSQERCS